MNRLALALSVVLAAGAVATSALADPPAVASTEPANEQRLPVAMAERPLTLPRLILSPTAEFDVTRIQANQTYANVNLGAEFGVTDDLEVHALVVPLQVSGPVGNEVHYGETSQYRGPSVGATYRFARGVAELGVGLDLRLITAQALSGVVIIPGLPLRIHLGKSVRLDLSPQLNITRATSTAGITETSGAAGVVLGTPSTSASAVRLDVPLSVLVNLLEPLHVGVKTGVTIDDFSEAKTSTGIPVGVFAGYAIGGRKGPIVDIDPFFTFPYLIMPGRTPVTNSGEYTLGLSLAGYLYL